MNIIKEKTKNLFTIISTPSMRYLPGNLAFFLVLSIFPILTLIGVIASKFSINVSLLVNAINTTLPSNVSSVLVGYVQGKGFDTNIGIFMIIGFYLASNGSNAIILASNNLYGFPNSDYISRRIKALILTIILILLFMFILIFLAFGSHILNILLKNIPDKSLVSIIKNSFLVLKWPFSIFVIFFNIKLIYTIAPDWKVLSKHTTRGAVFTTLSWIVVVQFYTFWVTHFSNYDIFYGSLSNIVVLMLMTYIISYILIVGVAINVKTYEYKIED